MPPLRPLLAALLALTAGCSAAAPLPRCAFPADVSAAPFHYTVAAGPAAEELCVDVALPAGTDRIRGARELQPFVRGVEVHAAGGSWEPVDARPSGFTLPGCDAAPCRARYRVLLGDAARALDDRDAALEHRGTLFSPPSAWLLRPAHPPDGARYELRVTVPPGVAFVTGLLPDAGGQGWGGAVADLEGAPYSAFGALTVHRVTVPGGVLSIGMSAGKPAMEPAAVQAWIEASARSVAAYFGRFPIAHAAVIVLFRAGKGVANGATMGTGGASVMLAFGEDTRPANLARDWILVHELVHVSFPNVGRPWAEEGMATYLEPIIRARAGLLSPDEVWRDLIEGLPNGQPEAGDKGLNHTDTWGRRYWGGAMFWLLADLEIRKRSNGAHSLDDALRRVVDQGGNVAVTWSLEHALDEADRASGLGVLRELRAKHGESPVKVDLDALWNDLGVHLVRGRVVYDDAAPLAAARRGIGGRAPAPAAATAAQ